MAVSTKITNRTEEIVSALKECRHMSLNERDDYIGIMLDAKNGANGLPTEEKLQACSENIANLCYLIIRDKLEGGGGRAGLYVLIYRCRWQIVILAGFITLLLAFRPQLAAIIEAALIH